MPKQLLIHVTGKGQSCGKKSGSSQKFLFLVLARNTMMLQHLIIHFHAVIHQVAAYWRLKTKETLNFLLWKWLQSLTRGGHLQEVPNIVIQKLLVFRKLTALSSQWEVCILLAKTMLIKVILINILSCRPLFMLLWGQQLQECWRIKTSSMRIMNHKFFLNHCVSVSVCLFSRIGGTQPITCTLGNSGTLDLLWLNWIVTKGICGQLPIDTFNRPLINTQLTSRSTLDQHLSQQWVRGDWFFTDRPLSVDLYIRVWIGQHSVYCGAAVNQVSLEWWQSIDQDVYWVSIEMSMECRLRVDQGYWLTLNHGCLYSNHDPLNLTSFTVLLSLDILPLNSKKVIILKPLRVNGAG